MQASFSHSFHSKLFLLLILSCFVATIGASKKEVSAMYVFGDSTVDPGNNNFIDSAFRSNFPPYGRDFVNQVPTGRFTNGKLGTDFIASYLGLKDLLPPYLDPNLSDKEIITGVSFASAGSGFDPLTPTLGNVISIPKQLEHFKEYKQRLEGMLGEGKTEYHMNNAFFFISAGTNDYVINYFSVPIRRNYTPLTYGQFLLQHVKDFIQNLWKEGARKIALVGLPPMGCLPIVITLNSHNVFFKRGCVDKYSAVARHYNMMLQHELFLMQLNFSNVPLGAKISYIDIYEPLNNMIQWHENFGFDEVDHGCCGSGYIETTFMCNGFSFVCSDPSKFVFWDSIHPTEKAYFHLFMVARPNIDALINA
ncbi:GDSL esterase/lipase At5g45960 [Vigna radiata var. radiata]|uniref:GDSL esterase/lipase At5g45960 n=1 Tax=Vigna radiata var. radiata TaxID=3916 RepID=A0A1S3UK29_VIGRR|nr:GDSL esterase/lipase At5g45960 [Vigna radiata var. radiata]